MDEVGVEFIVVADLYSSSPWICFFIETVLIILEDHLDLYLIFGQCFYECSTFFVGDIIHPNMKKILSGGEQCGSF